MASYPSGVGVVTTRDGDEPRGLTTTALCSVSARPPLLLVCVDVTSPTLTSLPPPPGAGAAPLRPAPVPVGGPLRRRPRGRLPAGRLRKAGVRPRPCGPCMRGARGRGHPDAEPGVPPRGRLARDARGRAAGDRE